MSYERPGEVRRSSELFDFNVLELDAHRRAGMNLYGKRPFTWATVEVVVEYIYREEAVDRMHAAISVGYDHIVVPCGIWFHGGIDSFRRVHNAKHSALNLAIAVKDIGLLC